MYILDTHTLLWYLRDSNELSDTTRNTIIDAEYICTGAVSLWETKELGGVTGVAQVMNRSK